jgi:hypothetical protein
VTITTTIAVTIAASLQQNLVHILPLLSRDCTVIHDSIESNRFVIVMSSVCVCERIEGYASSHLIVIGKRCNYKSPI